jgi:hypothetical protein
MPSRLNFRTPQADDNSFEPRWPIEIEVLAEARIKHIHVSPKRPEHFYKSSLFNIRSNHIQE